MPGHGKKYLEAKGKLEPGQAYSPEEAVKLVKETSFASFDATVEAHVHLGLDPKRADQQVRGAVVLPHGTGKKIRVLVFAQGETQRLAQEAGADYVGGDDLVEKIQGGWLDFDIAIGVPEMMSRISRLGRVLGPRGLMPSPRTGTVVPGEDVPRVVKEARQGRVEYRLDATANIHMVIGKVSFSEAQLLENFQTVMDAIVRAKPASARGQYIRNLALTSTMGPGVKVDVTKAQQMKAA